MTFHSHFQVDLLVEFVDNMCMMSIYTHYIAVRLRVPYTRMPCVHHKLSAFHLSVMELTLSDATDKTLYVAITE